MSQANSHWFRKKPFRSSVFTKRIFSSQKMQKEELLWQSRYLYEKCWFWYHLIATERMFIWISKFTFWSRSVEYGDDETGFRWLYQNFDHLSWLLIIMLRRLHRSGSPILSRANCSSNIGNRMARFIAHLLHHQCWDPLSRQNISIQNSKI